MYSNLIFLYVNLNLHIAVGANIFYNPLWMLFLIDLKFPLASVMLNVMALVDEETILFREEH